MCVWSLKYSVPLKKTDPMYLKPDVQAEGDLQVTFTRWASLTGLGTCIYKFGVPNHSVLRLAVTTGLLVFCLPPTPSLKIFALKVGPSPSFLGDHVCHRNSKEWKQIGYKTTLGWNYYSALSRESSWELNAQNTSAADLWGDPHPGWSVMISKIASQPGPGRCKPIFNISHPQLLLKWK